MHLLSLLSDRARRSKRRVQRRQHQSESLEARALLTNVLITVENLAPEGGLHATPFWVGFHDGTFDIGNPGEAAGGGLEELAEDGETDVLSERFGNESDGVDATITAPDGFTGAPVFDPGEIVSFEIDVDDTEDNQYFSFASMLIPSNDAFIGNLNPFAYKIFRNNGRFRGPLTIEVFGDEVYDAGTEVNNPQGGAPFSEGGDAVDENGVIHMEEMHLDEFVGTGTPVGDLQSAFSDNTPIARITISEADDPSDPIDTDGPRVTLGELRGAEDGSDSFEIDVVYSDPSGVDLDTINVSDVRVFTDGAFGNRRLRPTDAEVSSTDSANRTVTATYTFDAPDGEFVGSDSGTLELKVRRNRVRDAEGNGLRAVRPGSFEVGDPAQLSVTVENLAESGGLYLTPFFVAVHDGSFDIGTRGQRAENFGGLEDLAEEGITDGLTERLAEEVEGSTSATITAPDGFQGAPVFSPGEVVTQTIDVNNPSENRFFSFASMLIPSNDAFVANLARRAHSLFNSRGEFRGPLEITIYGNDVYDAGTEENSPTGGAAFSTGGGESTDEGGRIRRSNGLDDFIGTGIPTGSTINSAFSRQTPIARITIDLA